MAISRKQCDRIILQARVRAGWIELERVERLATLAWLGLSRFIRDTWCEAAGRQLKDADHGVGMAQAGFRGASGFGPPSIASRRSWISRNESRRHLLPVSSASRRRVNTRELRE